MSPELRRLFEGTDDLDIFDEAVKAEEVTFDEARLARIGRAIEAAAPAQARADGGDARMAPTSVVSSKGPFVLLALACAAGFVGIEIAASRRPTVSASPPAIASTSLASEVAPEPLPSTPPPAIVSVSPADLPSAPPVNPGPAASPRRQITTQASAPVESSDEIALLARAHDAIRDNPAESLALCREHRARFADGDFAQEREAIAIEALVRLGRREEAVRRWDAFSIRYPSSTHRVHLKNLVSTLSSSK